LVVSRADKLSIYRGFEKEGFDLLQKFQEARHSPTTRMSFGIPRGAEHSFHISAMESMESFSLALDFRAAQEAVKDEISAARVWATRLALFCDVMSALLVIQLGQFSHPAPRP